MCQKTAKTGAKSSADTCKIFFENLKQNLLKEDFLDSNKTFIYDEMNLSDYTGEKKCLSRRGDKYSKRIKDSTEAANSISFLVLQMDKFFHPPPVVYTGM